MIRYKNEKGVDLLSKNLLSKFDNMRANVSAIEIDDDVTMNDHDPTGVWDIPSDGDESGVAIPPSDDATSSPANRQITNIGDCGESGDTEGIVPEGSENRIGDTLATSLDGTPNQRESPTPFSHALETDQEKSNSRHSAKNPISTAGSTSSIAATTTRPSVVPAAASRRLGLPSIRSSSRRLAEREKTGNARPDEERSDQRRYQQQIGSLMYLMTGTRPDLAYGDDKKNRRSTCGHALLFGQGACIWASKKQRSVATSTTEAEYVALTEASKTVVWATRWLQELHIRKPEEDPIRILGDKPPEDEAHRYLVSLHTGGARRQGRRHRFRPYGRSSRRHTHQATHEAGFRTR